MENEPGQSNRGDILHLMMGVLKEDVISIDGLGFDDKLPSDNLSHLQRCAILIVSSPQVTDSKLIIFYLFVGVKCIYVSSYSGEEIWW
ncbi:hypothetical protein Tco_0092317 [Tanacetum coccineum]